MFQQSGLAIYYTREMNIQILSRYMKIYYITGSVHIIIVASILTYLANQVLNGSQLILADTIDL